MLLEHDIVRRLGVCGELHGRRKITLNYERITPQNAVEVLGKAKAIHNANALETQYLWDVYCGVHDIRHKEKIVRPNINNKLAINLCNYIVTFKSAYLLSSPVQYVSADSGKEDTSDAVSMLNKYMDEQDKESKDKLTVDWTYISGVAPRLCVPNPDWTPGDEYTSPFAIYALDPREAFVIYSSHIGKRPIGGVVRQYDENDCETYALYTPDGIYQISEDRVDSFMPYSFGTVPIVEYINNEARLGAFEIILPIQNMVNTLESNRIDNIVDFVNAYDVFKNCEVTEETYGKLAAGGAVINIASTPGVESDVYRISSELSQTGVQTVIESLLDYVNVICGLPNRNGANSTSDTGSAVQFRDGWQEAESRATDTEAQFKKSEKQLLGVAFRIMEDRVGTKLSTAQIDIRFTRKNLTNIQSKAQVLCEMLNNDLIHPRVAYECAGVLPDIEESYRLGMEWREQNKKELEEELSAEVAHDRTVSAERQNDSNADAESGGEIQ